MGAPIQWTAEMDETLRSMRAAGASKLVIARFVGFSTWAVGNRLDKLGARKPLPPPKPIYEPTGFAARPPMPPGHHVSWSLLLAHTPSIAGTPYPAYRPLPFRLLPMRSRDAAE